MWIDFGQPPSRASRGQGPEHDACEGYRVRAGRQGVKGLKTMPMRPTSPSRASRGQKGPKTMPCHTAECGWSRELGGGARKKLMQSGSSLFCLSALLCLSALFCLSALVCSPVTQRHSTLMRGMRVIRGIAIERIVVRLEVFSPQTTLRLSDSPKPRLNHKPAKKFIMSVCIQSVTQP